MKTSSGSRYILYCRGDVVFENTKREMLLGKNINRLFIKKEDQQKYYKYLESNFQDIVSDTRISSDEKVKIVHSAAINLMKDLFTDQRTGTIERTKTYAYNIMRTMTAAVIHMGLKRAEFIIVVRSHT
ncbi:MAG: hypothetical protein ACE5GV_18220 [Candidatus Scalindua sp.]